jgi:protein-S-isoprenylcysteine O-methyltransferase Ste14
MAAGFALDCSAMLTMWRQHANILPHRKATSLVTTGPFLLSRNPIYLGNTMMLLGAAAVFSNVWFVAVTPFAVVTVTRLAIRREERHMGETFGAAWRDYVGRVPRWLRWRLWRGV